MKIQCPIRSVYGVVNRDKVGIIGRFDNKTLFGNGSNLHTKSTLVPESFFYSLLANFATRTASFFIIINIILKESLWDRVNKKSIYSQYFWLKSQRKARSFSLCNPMIFTFSFQRVSLTKGRNLMAKIADHAKLISLLSSSLGRDCERWRGKLLPPIVSV